MRRVAVARARLWVGAVACAGVAFSHGIAYRLVAPDAPRRAELMTSTGHRYFALVVAAALVALVVGLGDFVAESIASRGKALRPRKLFSFAAGRLTALQAAGFVVLEALERLSGGAPTSHRCCRRRGAPGPSRNGLRTAGRRVAHVQESTREEDH